MPSLRFLRHTLLLCTFFVLALFITELCRFFFFPVFLPYLQLFLSGAVQVLSILFLLRQKKPFLFSATALMLTGAWCGFLFSIYRLVVQNTSSQLYFSFSAACIWLWLLMFHFGTNKDEIKENDPHSVFVQNKKTTTLFQDMVGKITPLAAIVPGDILKIHPQERLAFDGVAVSDTAILNEASLCGNCFPKRKCAKERVHAGSLNTVSDFFMQVTSKQKDFLHPICKPSFSSPVEAFSRILLPTAAILAVLTFSLWFFLKKPLSLSIARGVSVYLASCAYLVPLLFSDMMLKKMHSTVQGAYQAKNPSSLPRLHQADTIIFDKTGTLTQGHLSVVDIIPINCDKETLLCGVYALASQAEHPFFQTLCKEIKEMNVSMTHATMVQKQPEVGLWGQIHQSVWVLGNQMALEKAGISTLAFEQKARLLEQAGNFLLFAGADRDMMGIIVLSDRIRPEACEVIDALKAEERTVLMLSGDSISSANAAAAHLSLHAVHAPLTPKEKAAFIRRLQEEGHVVAFVGDGLNDIPALATADVGLSMAQSPEAVFAHADIWLLDNNLMHLLSLMKASKKIRYKLRWDMIRTAVYLLISLPVAALGFFFPLWGESVLLFGSGAVILHAWLLKKLFYKKQ